MANTYKQTSLNDGKEKNGEEKVKVREEMVQGWKMKVSGRSRWGEKKRRRRTDELM